MAYKIKTDLEIDGSAMVGEYTLPATDGTANQVLKTDGLGAVAWQDDLQSVTLGDLTDVTGIAYASGAILVSDGVDSYDEQVMSGDVTIDVTGGTTISAGAIDLAMFADISNLTVLGNVSGGVAAPAEVTIDTDLSTVPGDDSEIASSDAIVAYVGSEIATAITGLTTKYVDDFLIADWAGAGPYTLTYAATTHGLGATKSLIVQVQEEGTPNLVVEPQIEVANNGDITITATTSFNGSVTVIG